LIHLAGKLENKMKVMVLCGDRWHPGDVPRQGLLALGEAFSFDWNEDARRWSVEELAQVPLVVLAKSNNISASDESGWMTEAIACALVEHVRQGNGLLALHSGIAGYDPFPALCSLLGGVFSQHPDQCPVTMEPRAGHPLCARSAPFNLTDEHYFVRMEDKDADVFLTTRSVHGEQPAGWRRSEGQGRVAVLTPGHNLEVWLQPSFQALLRNSLEWCAKEL
jgi:uncharacterized protein